MAYCGDDGDPRYLAGGVGRVMIPFFRRCYRSWSRDNGDDS